MAQYRLSVDYVSRTKGQSVVAKAAYRAGERLDDRRYGVTHDYTRKGGVAFAGIVTPEGEEPPDWTRDRGALWNHVEVVEAHPRAQLARDIELNLPHELTPQTRQGIAVEFAQHVADTYGFVVDVAIHAPHHTGDERNHHAHLLFATRPLDDARANGFSRSKDRRFNDVSMQREDTDNEVEDLREVWEIMQNRALEREDVRDADGNPVRVSRFSYERQGIEQEPTLHEGVEATALKRRGEHSERAALNDEIRASNVEREEVTQSLRDNAATLLDLLRAVKRTPLEDDLKWQYRDEPTMQAAFEIVAQDDVQTPHRILAVEQQMKEEAQRDGLAAPTGLDVLQEFGRQSRAARQAEEDATPANRLFRILSATPRESDRAFPTDQEQREEVSRERDSVAPAKPTFEPEGFSFG